MLLIFNFSYLQLFSVFILIKNYLLMQINFNGKYNGGIDVKHIKE